MVVSLGLVVLLSLGADSKSDAKSPAKDAKPPKVEAPAVQCPAWIYFEPHFWSRHIADAPLATPVVVLSQTGTWDKVRVANEEGFVSAAALAPPPGDLPSRQAEAAYLTREGLTSVEAWLIRYEGAGTGARMRARLEDLRSFIRDGSLQAAK